MSDAGEGLVDADSRIQERMEELERERTSGRNRVAIDPVHARAVESLKLARIELERQRAATMHDRHRAQLVQAIEEVERRLAVAVVPKG